MKQLKTLRLRFALWVALLLLAALAGFGVFVYISVACGLSSAVDDSLRLSATQAIAAVNVENGQINISDSIPEATTVDWAERGLTVRILDPAGDVLQALGTYRAVPVDSRILPRPSRRTPPLRPFRTHRKAILFACSPLRLLMSISW